VASCGAAVRWGQGLLASLASAASLAAPTWAVDPTEPGPDRGATGASSFEQVLDGEFPFPFEALLRRIEQRLGCAPGACTTGVLIPFGRSLQRTVAAPDYLASPRIVVAVTGEGSGPAHAKDRLYLGYQPRGELLEVISYNDAAGRFEFQLLHDYRAGVRPRLVMAEREVCLACHQNHAPIFSRPLWQETNANPRLAAAMREAGHGSGRIEGVALVRGVDLPNAIDEATDRANLYSVTQRLWREACDAGCRAAAVAAAFEYGRSGGRRFDPVPGLAARFAERWPDGLAVPNPDVPNRDPLADPASPPAHVPAAFEALQPRPALETWQGGDEWLERRFVRGIAAFLADADLAAVATAPERARQRLLDQDWGDVPLSRVSLRAALGLAADAECCRSPGATAGPTVPRGGREVVSARAAGFVTHCARCHATSERAPPNFLAGDARRVEASLASCAPRIYVRLAMWQAVAAARVKVPMPPPRAARAGRELPQEVADPGIDDLRRTVARWLREETGREPDLETLLARGYEDLRPCLPAGA
jgi:hypothetical protein